jgi:hypothetical protein
LRCDVGEPGGQLGAARENQLAAAGAQRRHDQAGIVGAVDQQLMAQGIAQRLQVADAGVVGGAGCAAQLDRAFQVARDGERGAGLLQVVDDDLERYRAFRSTATPGNSLPSSQSRNAPPAVEA